MPTFCFLEWKKHRKEKFLPKIEILSFTKFRFLTTSMRTTPAAFITRPWIHLPSTQNLRILFSKEKSAQRRLPITFIIVFNSYHLLQTGHRRFEVNVPSSGRNSNPEDFSFSHLFIQQNRFYKRCDCVELTLKVSFLS